MIKREEAFFGDFHIHSSYSRACSKDLNIENLVKWAKIKGIGILGTGDFTHPKWLEQLKEKLKSNQKGFYYYNDFPFILSGEISLIYTQGEKGRRVHLVLLAPSFEAVDKINLYLDTKGRRDYDGRPIFKIKADEFTKEMKKISEAIEIIPAHIWTPWFGVLGSKSYFSGLKEAFGEEFKNIYSIETGISSDPKMNWNIPDLKEKAIISFSDSHSFWPWRLGREATIFKKTDSYFEIIEQIRKKTFLGTVETDPAYGKYHLDGHRDCNFSCDYKKTKELNKICPHCNKELTIGVEYRVKELSKEFEFPEKNKKFYYSILPLHELISIQVKSGVSSKKVWNIYNEFLKEFQDEFNILCFIEKEEMIKKGLNKEIIDLIIKNREGKLKVKPGYDGVYGEIILEKEDQEKLI